MAEARVLFKKAADQGHVKAQHNLANMLHKGEGGPVNMAEARVQYKKAAGQGHSVAHHKLALMLNHGEGGPVDLAGARVHYKMAADKGHPLAQDMLADILQQEETARIAFEQLMAEERQEREINGKKKEKKKESTIGGETTCIVCFTGDKNHVAVPCGHQTVCGPCSEKLEECPVCRAKAQPWVRVRIA